MMTTPFWNQNKLKVVSPINRFGISPNIEKEESGIKDDSGMQDVQYTEVRCPLYRGNSLIINLHA
jgi:hypothetical protein